MIEAQVLGTSAMAGKAVRDAELPEHALIGLIQKGDKLVVPRGDTRLAEGDILTICRHQQPEMERPKDFTAKAGSDRALIKWERVK